MSPSPRTGASGMEALALAVLAVAAGVVAFSSPCCLPLLPGYLSSVWARPVSELEDAGAGHDHPGGAATEARPTPSRGVSRRCWRALAAVAGAVVAAALLAGCGEGGPADTHDPYAEMEQGLGRARERAVAADPEGARREFFDAAHDPLHRLAAEAAERDRAGAARLLEAKQAVEQSLAEASPTLDRDLDRLLAAVADARRASGGDESGPSGENR